MYSSGITGRRPAPQRHEGSKLPSTKEVVLALPAFLITALKEVPGSYLAGGALRAQYDNCGIKDYDIFFRDSVAKDAFKDKFEEHMSECTGPDVITFYVWGHAIQLIYIQYFETMEALVDYFDMTCNQIALSYEQAPKIEYPGPFAKHSPAPTGEWKYINPGYGDAIDRKIRFHNPNQLNNTISRIETFKQRGYTVEHEEYERLLKYIREETSFTATASSTEQSISEQLNSLYKQPSKSIAVARSGGTNNLL
jgi:hypothetical protein